ncbi:MAG: thymidine phosphorylase, partial [Pseudomonadota bacterium]
LGAIPGYDVAPGVERLRDVVTETGCAIIGQTGEVAPADKRLYAIRDVTGTVESIDLITASILSKKLAAGLSALVLDVKTGSGAFMADPADAHALAESLTSVANGAGCKTAALVTDMNAPLASAAGNALEVWNAAAFLTGAEIDNRLWDVTVALGGTLLALAGLADSAKGGEAKIAAAFESGAAAERFGRMVAALGGPVDFLERFDEILPKAPVIRSVSADRVGPVTAIDVKAIGWAVVELGGGRRRPEDAIDLSVGFEQLAGIGDLVDDETPLGRVHAATPEAAEAAASRLRAAYTTGAEAPVTPLIRERLG